MGLSLKRVAEVSAHLGVSGASGALCRFSAKVASTKMVPVHIHELRALFRLDDEVVHALFAVHVDGERRADTEHGVALEPG